ncbi:MAG TPA: hypothetical protein P5555_06205 [Candidatus Paceibacterota bacterium]|nr:hypothetical protein [Verrucomicrobiota bacterium]HOX04081.1 hypothetical protein [Verrucomicrobiota bacterium]HRZ44764.1 hypothetical protein [Candidatus Paceibacterota bacterium]HRZ92332.1 hypothetical protein [Candidatus Paceibacterota bacterium]
MKTSSDHNPQLASLLAWKRHEVPPPGYFEDLRGRVLDRLRLDPADAPATFWERWLRGPWFEPVFTGAYTLAACGLLLFGIGYARSFERHSEAALASAASAPPPIQVRSVSLPVSHSAPSDLVFEVDRAPALVSRLVSATAILPSGRMARPITADFLLPVLPY